MSVSTPGATEQQGQAPSNDPTPNGGQGQAAPAGQGQQPNQDSPQQGSEAWLDSASAEELREYTKSLRSEAARYRMGRKSVTQERDELAAKVREIEERDMSEAQKEKRRNEELSKENSVLRRESLVRQVAKDKGIPVEWEDRLRGDTKEALEQDAETLAQQLGSSGSPPTGETEPPANGGGGHRDWGQGQRGGSGSSESGDMNALIRGGLRSRFGG